MARVFISYSRRNQDRVDALVSELERLGVGYWIDRNDIPASVAWFDEVKAAIQETDFFVECQSPEYELSEQCQVELKIARDLGKQILGVRILGEVIRLAAARITAAVHGCPPDVRAHTELVTRSAAWERADRDRGLLISGEPLRKARRLIGRGTVTLPPVALDLVRASRRRQRRFRQWTALGVTVVALAGVLLLISGLVQAAFRTRTEENLNRFVALNRPPEPDIYRELNAAAAQARTKGFAYLSRMPLVRALSVRLPERSYLVPGNPLTGFTTDIIRTTEPPVSRVPRVPVGAPKLPDTPSGPVADLATAPDRALVAASFANDGMVRIFTTPTLAPAATIAVPTTSSRLAFSGNGRFLAVSVGPDVWVHDVRTGLRLGQLRGSVGTVRDLAWSADGTEVWAVAGDNRVSSWRWRIGHVLIDDPALWFVSVAGPADNGELVATTRDGRVYRVQDTVTSELRTSARDTVSSAISHDAGQVAIGAQDRVIVHDPTGEHPIPLDNCVPTGLAFAPDGRQLYVACAGRPEIWAYDPASEKAAGSARLANTAASSITTDTRGTVFVGTTYGEVIRLSPDLASQQQVLRTSCDLPIRAVKSNGDGTVVVQTGDGAGDPSCLPSARVQNGRWVATNQAAAGESGEQGRAVGLTSNGKLAASGYSDGTIAFWTPDASQPSGNYRDFGGEVRGIAFTPDNTGIVVASRDGILETIDACRLCRATPDLITMAEEQVARAHQLGLT